MNWSPVVPIALSGFVVAFLHAATPTHWLPFVLVGRAQGWSGPRTLGITLLAGVGHVAFTAAIGLALMGAGMMIEPRLGAGFPRAVGAVLVALGLFYLIRHLLRPPQPPAPMKRFGTDAAAIVALLALLTFSPSEAFLPIYLANIRFGWSGFALLTLAFALGAALGMLLFTGLFMAGFDRLKLERLERYELVVVGVVLCLLGLFVAFHA